MEGNKHVDKLLPQGNIYIYIYSEFDSFNLLLLIAFHNCFILLRRSGHGLKVEDVQDDQYQNDPAVNHGEKEEQIKEARTAGPEGLTVHNLACSNTSWTTG